MNLSRRAGINETEYTKQNDEHPGDRTVPGRIFKGDQCMIPAEMVLGFFSSAKNNHRAIKITCGSRGVKKGYINQVSMDDNVIMVDLDGETYEIDMKVSEAKTSFFDRRVIHIQGEEHYKIQLA